MLCHTCKGHKWICDLAKMVVISFQAVGFPPVQEKLNKTTFASGGTGLVKVVTVLPLMLH